VTVSPWRTQVLHEELKSRTRSYSETSKGRDDDVVRAEIASALAQLFLETLGWPNKGDAIIRAHKCVDVVAADKMFTGGSQ